MPIKKDSSKQAARATNQSGLLTSTEHNNALNALSSFLHDHRAKKGEPATHNSMGQPLGSFYVPKDDMPLFMSYYTAAVMEGHRPAIVEAHKSISPMVIDLDFRQTTPDRLYTYDTISRLVKSILCIIVRFIEQPIYTCYVLEKPTPRLDPKSGKYKDGIHIHFPDVITVPALQHLIRNIFLQEESIVFADYDNDPSAIYDECVIDRNGWFMYMSKKSDEPAPWNVTYKFIFDGTHKGNSCVHKPDVSALSVPDLIRELSIRWDVTDESHYNADGLQAIKTASRPMLQTHTIQTSTLPTTTATTTTTTSIELAKQLVGMLAVRRAAEYEDWMRVGWALHNTNTDALFDTWVEFSKRCPQKFSHSECVKKWAGMRDKGTLTIRTLKCFAREDNPVAYSALSTLFPDHLTVAGSDYEDGDTFESIRTRSGAYDYAPIKELFERTHFKVFSPVCFVRDEQHSSTHNDNSTFVMYSERELCTVYKNVHVRQTKTNAKGETVEETKRFIELWLNDPTMRNYMTMDFLPPPNVCPENIYNMWHGFAVDSKKVPSSKNVAPFKNHISILVNHCSHAFEYFTSWLAQIVQAPGKLSKICVVLKSEQGCGKNIFLDTFAAIIGEEYYYETANPEYDLFSRFSLARKNKLLIDLNETNGKDTFKNNNQFKAMITDNKFQYEAKSINSITLRNFNRFIATTNNDTPIKIEAGDRRFVVFESSSEKKGKMNYFKDFIEYMADASNQVAIMEYLRSIDLTDYDWENNRPFTETYNTIRYACTCYILRFLEAIYNDHANDTAQTVSIKAREMFGLYKTWFADACPGKSVDYTEMHFGAKLSTYSQSSPTAVLKRKKMDGNYYVFYLPDLKPFLKSHGLLIDTLAFT